MNLEEVDWRKVRLISIDGTTVTLLLEDGEEQKFHFRSDQELSLALRSWDKQEKRLRALLQRSRIDRASSPRAEEDSHQTGL